MDTSSDGEMDVNEVTKSMHVVVTLNFYQDLMEEGSEMDKVWLIWWDEMDMVVSRNFPKCLDYLDGLITHDACFPSFHHGTCLRFYKYIHS